MHNRCAGCRIESRHPRTWGAKFGLEDLEADILMCCETTLSAVYVTPKWLVWVESSGRNDVAAGAAQLSQIGARNERLATQYAITSAQGLTIIGRYTDENRTGITFICSRRKAMDKSSVGCWTKH